MIGFPQHPPDSINFDGILHKASRLTYCKILQGSSLHGLLMSGYTTPQRQVRSRFSYSSQCSPVAYSSSSNDHSPATTNTTYHDLNTSPTATSQTLTPNVKPEKAISTKDTRRSRATFNLQGKLSHALRWSVVAVLLLLIWTSRNGINNFVPPISGGSPDSPMAVRPKTTSAMSFIPATDQMIRYVGRWSSLVNSFRKDAAFSGAYFEFSVRNSTSTYLSFFNQPNGEQENRQLPYNSLEYVNFGLQGTPQPPASPNTVLVIVDGDEVIFYPGNGASTIDVPTTKMHQRGYHWIRVLFPSIETRLHGVVQLQGIWIESTGTISPYNGLHDRAEMDMSPLDPFSWPLQKNGTSSEHKRRSSVTEPNRRILEIVTDSLESQSSLRTGDDTNSTELKTALSSVYGWDFLLGESLQVDHIRIAATGTGLVNACLTDGDPQISIADTFFRR